MPLYEYRCEACGKQFEKLVSASKSGETQVCPHCSSSDTRKELSCFSSGGGCGGAPSGSPFT